MSGWSRPVTRPDGFRADLTAPPRLPVTWPQEHSSLSIDFCANSMGAGERAMLTRYLSSRHLVCYNYRMASRWPSFNDLVGCLKFVIISKFVAYKQLILNWSPAYLFCSRASVDAHNSKLKYSAYYLLPSVSSPQLLTATDNSVLLPQYLPTFSSLLLLYPHNQALSLTTSYKPAVQKRSGHKVVEDVLRSLGRLHTGPTNVHV